MKARTWKRKDSGWKVGWCCSPKAGSSRCEDRSAQRADSTLRLRLLGTLAVLALVPLFVHAQYSIDWHTIDGGGGTSTSGVYSISGTIGQPDAGGPMTGGNYSLTGGFWALIAVQTPGAPFLSITQTGPGQATISWDPDTPGFVLQETLILVPDAWTNSPSGPTNPIVVPAMVPTKYYRVHKP